MYYKFYHFNHLLFVCAKFALCKPRLALNFLSACLCLLNALGLEACTTTPGKAGTLYASVTPFSSQPSPVTSVYVADSDCHTNRIITLVFNLIHVV